MRKNVMRAWGRILTGHYPSLSIEVTTKCPLSCPGCYAYHPDHVEGTPLVSLDDHRGDDLVDRAIALIDRERPLVVHLVGGEPMVRHRELDRLLPLIDERGIEVEVVTSAVVPIPAAWADLEHVTVVVSIDGLPAEHDERRKPATYERIHENIEGHRIVVHCTITSQMMERPGYLEEFVDLWSARDDVTSIRLSFLTPQVGENGIPVLTLEMRRQAVAEMDRLRVEYPKLRLTPAMLDAYLSPPSSPEECTFARVTKCVSADLESPVTPCQFGGTPDCEQCGCIASMGLHAIAEHRLFGRLRVGSIFDASQAVGSGVRRVREGIGLSG